MTANRSDALQTFLAQAGWDGADRTTIAGDASFRRYDRLTQDGKTAILMDAPPPMEDVRPFIAIARHLHDLGFSVPEILAADEEKGFLVLEDLGDDTYTRLLDRGADEQKLYALATDVLIALHTLPVDKAVPDSVPVRTDAAMLEGTERVLDWYLPLAGKALSEDMRAEHAAAWQDVFPKARQVPDGLILADYHVDNLLGLFDRPGIRACGLLDFQDAVRGPITYDLMSLVEDARRDIDPDLRQAMISRYLAAFPKTDRSAFEASYAIMAAQRHARVIGTFARLKVRDNKPGYLVHMPRLWSLLDRALDHDSLAPVKQWYDTAIPPDLRTLHL